MPTRTELGSQPIHSAVKLAEPVQDLCQRIDAQGELSEIFNLLTKEGTRLLNSEGASVLLLDKENCELWSQSTADGEVIRFDARLGIAGATVTTGNIINVTDAQHDQRFYAGVDTKTKKRTRNILAVPLKTPAGEIVGVFEALNKKGGPFSAHDEAIASALAAQAAMPLKTANLVKQLRNHQRQLQKENTQLWREVEGRFATQNLIGTSLRMQGIVRLIDQIRDSHVDVLITGENGTGKEVVAKAIHYNSPRARSPFVALNCAALPENLIESELFGIEKGVATGVEPRVGKFEQANGGTIFLDEIGDLGPNAQAKILRVLQERVLERVGGRSSISIDVRVLAATNKKLETAIAKRDFREDLYYRLKVVHIQTPPLREIPEDIPVLANYFLSKYSKEMAKEPKKISASALRSLEYYPWPGNIRQLENEMRRLVVTVRRTTITEDDLDEAMRMHSDQKRGPIGSSTRSLPQAVTELEERLIREGLLACHNNQVQTAKRLGLSRQGLIKKMKRYGIVSS